jgi:hypothetical protein
LNLNQLTFDNPTFTKPSHPGCSDLLTMAQKELTAFFNAVKELFGVEQAELSANEWLTELIAIDALPASSREWRSITAKVSSRLATRVECLIAN